MGGLKTRNERIFENYPKVVLEIVDEIKVVSWRWSFISVTGFTVAVFPALQLLLLGFLL